MLSRFSSFAFFGQNKAASLTTLKLATLLSLGFLIPVAVACKWIESQHLSRKVQCQKRGEMASKCDWIFRQSYTFLKLSGLADFSSFLLSSPRHRHLSQAERAKQRITQPVVSGAAPEGL